ncbi:uncharacterized protein LOC118196155 [Stegodyphus dumicola]|uniref:uncharacterized protein LOC118196155 n=1 Tax=Stegodyphus dumicola TaxID=202533 RepID=UPI0015B1AC82|nr:uncharacterized protein LOC118196155 [Stegodyphus dumicola]
MNVVTISGGESCQSSCAASDIASEPSSPSRPVTPQPMPPVPIQHCPYECLRADSEDSGLGPSPAKSLVNPTSPEGSISPIQFGRCEEEEEDDRSDSLLDLSPRTDNSYESEENHCSKEYITNSPEEGVHGLDSAFRHYCLPLTDCDKPAIPKSPKLSSQTDSFQFLLSTKNCLNSNQTRAEDFRLLHHSNHTMVNSSQFPSQLLNSEELGKESNSTDILSSFFDEQACRDDLESDTFCGQQLPLNSFTKAECIKNSNGLNLTTRVSPSSVDEDHHHPHSESINSDQLFVQTTHLNPKVVLIRSNFDNQSLYVEESNSRQSSYSDAANQGPLCNELNIDCTSSNCSQGSAVDSQNSSSVASGEDGACKWLNCNRTADANTTATDLVDHIRQCHVQSQPDDSKSYVCLWVGCKVYERPSCSRSWLERHVLLHGGSKPFRCIVDGCNQRFSSEVVLQRHVNSHFPQSRSNKGSDHANGRLCRRKRHKHRRRPQSHKSKDFFDDATMEHVRHNLYQLSSIEGMVLGGPPSAITFHSSVIARRIDESGKVNVLLHWEPENLVPDSWVAEGDIISNLEKTIPVSKLPREALQLPFLDALQTAGILSRPGKRKRK